MITNPSYDLPPNLMSGIQCRQMKVKDVNKADLERGVETACKEMLERTAGKGFPILIDGQSMSTSSVVAAVQRVVGAPLLYTHDGSQKNEATEAEVKEWVSRWKGREEKRVLIIDDFISRGWEAPEVIAIGKLYTQNLVMRTCGFCILIKLE